MKYIKTFESSYLKHDWVVPIKMPEFEVALWKIGMNDIDIKKWLGLNKNGVFTDRGKYPNNETITMTKSAEDNVSDRNVFTWYWYPITKSTEYNIFMGKLDITPKDIQEYNDYLDMKKAEKIYNL